MKYEITVEEINKLLAYLSKCPYGEVFPLVQLLTTLQKIEDNASLKNVVKKVANTQNS